jgi:hypothetical protein
MSELGTVPLRLVEKIERLPPELIAEVETFVDYLRWRGGQRKRIGRDCPFCAPPRQVWDNPDDAVYDDL